MKKPRRFVTNWSALCLWAGLLIAAAPGGVAAAALTENLLVDGGFDSTSAALQPWSHSPSEPWVAGEWNAEYAELVVGPQGTSAISPLRGDGMLHVLWTLADVSQAPQMINIVSQVIDISAYAASVERGDAVVSFSVYVNARQAGAAVKLTLRAADMPADDGSLDGLGVAETVSLIADGSPNGWQKLSGELALPATTRVLSLQLDTDNLTLPAEGIYLDIATVVATLSNSGCDCAQPQPWSKTDGKVDTFVLPVEDAIPGLRFATISSGSSGDRDFDQAGADRSFKHTITGLPQCVRSGSLSTNIQGVITRHLSNDTIAVGINSSGLFFWTRYIGDYDGIPGVLGSSWTGTAMSLSLDLAALPLQAGGTVDAIPQINRDRALDFFIQDDTMVDFVRLDLEYCPCSCAEVPPGLVAWLPLDEPSGTVANEIALDNDGSYRGSSVHVPAGMVRGARLFYERSYVEIPHSTDLDLGTGDFSIDAWIKIPATEPSVTSVNRSHVTILEKRFNNGSSAQGIWLYLDNDRLFLEIADGASYSAYGSGIQVSDNDWHLIAVTVDRDQSDGVIFYLDGHEVAPRFDPRPQSGSLDNSLPLYIARRSPIGGVGFSGLLDEFELFRSALSADEIAEIYDAGSVGKCADQLVTPRYLAYCLDQTSKSLPLEICNWGTEDQSYELSFDGLNAGYPDPVTGDPTSLAGPTSVTNQIPANPVTVPAGSCVDVSVSVTFPGEALPAVWDAGLQVNAQRVDGCAMPAAFVHLRGTGNLCYVIYPPDDDEISEENPEPFEAPIGTVSNLGSEPETVSFQVEIVPSPLADGPALQFPGLEPNERYFGQIDIASGETETITVDLVVLQHVPNAFHELVLWVEPDDGGEPEALGSKFVTTRAAEPSGRVCDADGDGSVNRNDIVLIGSARNTPAIGPDDPRDKDGDGTITLYDTRKCVLDCDLPRCAVGD
jgi:hypothetical protein